MNTRQMAYRPVLLMVVGVTVFFFQGCYIKWGDETIVGQEDTAFPGASVERGCVVKIERGGKPFIPDYKVLFQKPDGSHERFSRNAGPSSGLEVGKCYEWKLGLRDPSLEDLFKEKEGFESMKEIASGTVREINP